MIPQIVARTREISRAVVRLDGKINEAVKIGVDTEIVTPPRPPSGQTLTESDFFDILSKQVDPDDVNFTGLLTLGKLAIGCIIEWKKGRCFVEMDRMQLVFLPFSRGF